VSDLTELSWAIWETVNQLARVYQSFELILVQDTGFISARMVLPLLYSSVRVVKKAKKKILTWPNCFGLIIAGEKMNKLTKNYKDDLIKDLRNPKEAAEYLNAALQDGNQEIFLMALRDVAAARGIKNISKQTSLNRENMYRMLSNEGNPNLSSLSTILDNLGLKLAIEIKEIRPSHSV